MNMSKSRDCSLLLLKKENFLIEGDFIMSEIYLNLRV